MFLKKRKSISIISIMLICIMALCSCGKTESKDTNKEIPASDDAETSLEVGEPLTDEGQINFLDYICGDYQYTYDNKDYIVSVTKTADGCYSFKATSQKGKDSSDEWAFTQENITSIEDKYVVADIPFYKKVVLSFDYYSLTIYEADSVNNSVFEGTATQLGLTYLKDSTDDERNKATYSEAFSLKTENFFNKHLAKYSLDGSSERFCGSVDINYDSDLETYLIEVESPTISTKSSTQKACDDFTVTANDVAYISTMNDIVYFIDRPDDGTYRYYSLYFIDDSYVSLYSYGDNYFQDEQLLASGSFIQENGSGVELSEENNSDIHAYLDNLKGKYTYHIDGYNDIYMCSDIDGVFTIEDDEYLPGYFSIRDDFISSDGLETYNFISGETDVQKIENDVIYLAYPKIPREDGSTIFSYYKFVVDGGKIQCYLGDYSDYSNMELLWTATKSK